jgi:hypothetical protein
MRALVFLASLVIAGPSLAQQQLLVELRDADMDCADCQPVDMRIVFAGWSQPITTSDIGKTFNMPMDVLDNLSPILTSSEASFGMSFQLFSIGPGGPNLFGRVSSAQLTNGDLLNNPQVIRHAPKLGPNLSGYTISSITQTLNSLVITQQSSTRYLLNAETTVHMYGAPVPEPPTLLLIVFAHCLLRIRLPRR